MRNMPSSCDQHRRWLAGLWIALAVLAIPASGRAERANNDELWLGAGARALATSSANAITDASLAGGSLGYARDLGLSRSGVVMWAEGAALVGSATGSMFTSMSTRIDTAAFTGGLSARFAVRRWLVASVRAAVGVQRIELELDTGVSYEDAAWGGIAALGGAVDLLPLTRRPFGFGFRAEASYVLARGVSLSPERPSPDEVMTLPSRDLGFGELDLSGPAFTISAIVQF